MSNLKFNTNDIHVQPDDPHSYLSNNKGLNTVKYLMCRSLTLSDNLLSMSEDDYGLSYSNAVSTIFPSYLVLSDKILNLRSAHKKQPKKNKVLIYYGKVRYGLSFSNLKKIVGEFDEFEIIHRNYPADQPTLYKKLSESSLFVSIDPLTSLLHESTLLGTPAYVYDSAYKEFYDNFDFKLHGFYYDLKPSDLDKVFEESKDLCNIATDTAKSFMSNIDERTLYLINDIEKHFSNTIEDSNEISEVNSKITEAIEEDIKFFNEKWKVSAIFNCNSFNTIRRYHLINKYKFFSFFIILAYRIISNIKKFFQHKFFAKIYTIEETEIFKQYFKKNLYHNIKAQNINIKRKW